MTIDDVKSFISTATTENLNQILDAIGARLNELETPSPEARMIRSAIRLSRARTSRMPGKGEGVTVCAIREGMKSKRGEI